MHYYISISSIFNFNMMYQFSDRADREGSIPPGKEKEHGHFRKGGDDYPGAEVFACNYVNRPLHNLILATQQFDEESAVKC